MRHWFKRIFGNRKETQFTEWRTENSIFFFLSCNIDNNGKLKDTAHDLPDEIKDEDKLRYAPGLRDAIFGADNSHESKKNVVELANHLERVAKEGSEVNKQEFYRLITENENAVGIIDEFLQAIVKNLLSVEPFLFSFAKDLATKTNKRNAVKFGIAILGLCQNKTVIKELKILGLHDEFTVYSAIAITNLLENPVSDLWDLAQKVNGWGKIQLVDRLANMELNQQIKDWLILEGYKNNILYEYLAFTCAVNGQLHEKLESKQIDNNLFKASADIIGALIMVGGDGPAEGITTYVYAYSVVENFIRHAKQHTSDISDFITLNKIKDFLYELQNNIGEQKQNGWTWDNISNCIVEIVEILNSRDWKVQTCEGLKSKDNLTYWNAKKAAEKLGIDLWETVWTRLQENPLDSSHWYDVTRYGKPEHAELIINFAIENLPLDKMATGAKDSMGFGSSLFMCLDTIITYLEDYPQKGEKIILTGLKSPVTRNRNMAIKVLGKWKRERWSTEIEKEIQYLKDIDPNKNTKWDIEKILNGEELE